MTGPQTIPLAAIIGRSRFNVRPNGEDKAGREAKAASLAAVGQIQAMLVRQAAHPEQYEIDDGGCRWDAMRLLVDRGTWTWQHPVDVVVVNGGDALAIERSLAANILRRQLHPVEEFEAFAALVGAGLAIEAVAADFGQTVRFVRQRLKLVELSPRARTLWRDGRINAELAGVLTGFGDHAAQDAVIERYDGKTRGPWMDYVAGELRRELAQRGIRADAPIARYVGIDAYVAAGGALDEQLFDEHPLLLDPPLLKRLARARMIAEAEPLLAATGCGSIVVRDEISADEQNGWGRLDLRYTKVQSAELDRLSQREVNEAPEGLEDDADDAASLAYHAACKAHDARFESLRERIEHEALRKSTTPEERQAAAVWVWIGYDGELLTDVGRTPPKPGAAAKDSKPAGPAVERPFAATAAPKRQASSTDLEPEPSKPPGKALVAVLDDAMSKGYAALVAERPYLAMLLATAALTPSINESAIRISSRPRSDVQRTALDFMQAFAEALVGSQSRQDLMLRFARAVAGTIVVAPTANYDGRRHGKHEAIALAELMAAYAGDGHDDAMTAALDYDAFFAAATKTATLAAIEAAGGDLVAARKLGKADLAQAATTLCRDRKWLPAELRCVDRATLRGAGLSKLPEAMPSLADAMAEALEQDGAFDEPGTTRTAVDAMQDFLMGHCSRADDREMVKAQVLFDAFKARMPAVDVALVPSMQAFGKLLSDYGITKKRVSTGFHYLGLDLVEPAFRTAPSDGATP